MMKLFVVMNILVKEMKFLFFNELIEYWDVYQFVYVLLNWNNYLNLN